MLSTQEFLILDYELSQTPALRELREGRGTHCVAGVSEIKDFDAYTPTGSFFVASSCRSTYCRIPPLA